jgi:hypothetical protein
MCACVCCMCLQYLHSGQRASVSASMCLRACVCVHVSAVPPQWTGTADTAGVSVCVHVSACMCMCACVCVHVSAVPPQWTAGVCVCVHVSALHAGRRPSRPDRDTSGVESLAVTQASLLRHAGSPTRAVAARVTRARTSAPRQSTPSRTGKPHVPDSDRPSTVDSGRAPMQRLMAWVIAC